MFRFADLNRVVWPVEIGGATFRVDFEVYTRKELQSIRRRSAEIALARVTDGDAPKTADEIREVLDAAYRRNSEAEEDLRKRVKGWFDVEDRDGVPFDFSPERLQALLDTDFGFNALMAGLLEASREGPPKNSQPGPAGLPARDQA